MYFKFEKPRRYYHLLNSLPIAVCSHWAFQGILYMDWSERLFKIGLDGLLTLLIWLLVDRWLNGLGGIFASFLIAHTLNFLFNGHLWGILKFYDKVHWKRAEFVRYTRQLWRRASKQTCFERVLLYGSVACDQWRSSSDLDVRLVRRPGLLNGILACFFAMSERTRALFAHFPLDIYVSDDEKSLPQKLKETPIEVEMLE